MSLNGNVLDFLTFKSTLQDFPVISRMEIGKYFPGFDSKNLVRWQQKGYLLRVRNNWYCFADRRWEERLLFWASNRIYSPSYVSLETALSFYGLIPEGVFTVQAVTTRKTASFATPIGNFSYTSIKPAFFFGYRLEQVGPWYAAIADPARALLDLLYFRHDLSGAEQFEGLRLNLHEVIRQVDMEMVGRYLQLYGGRALEQRARRFFKYVEKNRGYAFNG